MDGNKLLRKLSQNLLEVLDNGEYYDIMIEVGDGKTHAKIFRAHMAILNYRSPYLREILFENKWKNYDGTLVRIELPNILPEIFQVILRYIYGGKLTLKNYDNLYIIKLLIAANELSIKELVIYIQLFLINNRANWLEQNFYLIYQTIFENYSFLELQTYCNNLMSKNPNKIFESLDFPSIPEKIFISIIQNDNLQMDVVQIWKNVLKWGLAQNPELSSEPLSYSKDDFNNLRNTLEQCIPFIKFYDLTSKEFSDNILPYRKIIPEELYLDLLQSFLNLHPDSKLNISKPHMVKEINPSQHNINKSIEIFNPAPFSRTNKRRVRRYRQRLKKIFSQIDSENCSRGFGRGLGRGRGRGRGGGFGRGRDEGDEGEICFRGGYGRGRDEGEIFSQINSENCSRGRGRGRGLGRGRGRGGRGYGRGRDEGETPINYSSWDRVVLVRDTWNTEEHLKYTWEKPTKDAWDFTLDGSAGEWGETPVAPQSGGGWGELIEEPEAGGWGEEPEASQSAGGWGEEPEAPQSAGGWGETPVTTATGGWDELIEEPEAPQSAGTAGSLDDTQVAPQFVDDVKTSISSDYVSGRSTEKDSQSSTIIENSNTKKKKNKKKKV
ncbi:hypothetical protein RhiirB3_472779 [Rhizophagus irregularis]|nr:hypothetical protein RhiirB3_472779 [Rhizophagus irregularis]